MVKSLIRFIGLLGVAGLILAGGEAGITAADAGPASTRAAPGDLLSDGYDALGADRPDLARKIFQTLLNAYPQSTEAATAADELANLEDAAREGALRSPSYASDDAPTPSGSVAAGSANHGTGTSAQALSTPPLPGPAVPRHKAASATAEQLSKAQMHFLTDVGDRVFFAENSDVLGGRARAVVDAQARWLANLTNVEVTVIGRAADGGSAAENKALSLARAKAVEARLVAAGLPPERIKVEARGNLDPIATCTTPMCEAQNRHVETALRLVRPQGDLASGGGHAGSHAGSHGGSLARQNGSVDSAVSAR